MDIINPVLNMNAKNPNDLTLMLLASAARPAKFRPMAMTFNKSTREISRFIVIQL